MSDLVTFRVAVASVRLESLVADSPSPYLEVCVLHSARRTCLLRSLGRATQFNFDNFKSWETTVASGRNAVWETEVGQPRD